MRSSMLLLTGVVLLAAGCTQPKPAKAAFAGKEPQVSSVDPAEVKVDWEGTVTFRGWNFTKDCLANFDRKFTKTTFVSENELTTEVTKEITKTASTQEAGVHDLSTGSFSNFVPFKVVK